MKLRHVLLFASALGACGALLLAADMHRRLKEAENAVLLEEVLPGRSPGAAMPGVRSADDAMRSALLTHSLGLVSLAFLFLAVFLLLISALRDRAFAAALDKESVIPAVQAAAATSLPIVMPLAEVAKEAIDEELPALAEKTPPPAGVESVAAATAETTQPAGDAAPSAPDEGVK